MSSMRVGFAMCGSFCTFKKALETIRLFKENDADIYPIMSEKAYSTDTRFGTAQSFISNIESMTQKKIIHTIEDAEPIGPKKLLDILVVEPCTGNTLGKIANGITDTSVTMAVKAHLRNERPVLLAVSTNDALGASAQNIGKLMNRKNIFFVPLRQDDFKNKPSSAVADFSLTYESACLALEGKQLEPLLR